MRHNLLQLGTPDAVVADIRGKIGWLMACVEVGARGTTGVLRGWDAEVLAGAGERAPLSPGCAAATK